MTRGMRLMIMVMILIGVVIGMMQCASKTMHKKKPQHQEDGTAQ
jgi:disulfide bond formation protein DsbB